MPLPIDELRGELLWAAEELSLPLSAAEADKLLGFIALLQRWNQTYNLTSVREPAQMLTQHLVDCLAVMGSFRARLGFESSVRVLDVGSGGGLPGVVIAALNPGWHVTCVDAVGKKAAFVTQVAGELKLRNLFAAHSRVERLRLPPFDLMVSRAFSSLSDFVVLTKKLMSTSGCWAAMKGKRPDAELALLPPEIDAFHVEPLHVPGLNAERCLVWMKQRN